MLLAWGVWGSRSYCSTTAHGVGEREGPREELHSLTAGLLGFIRALPALCLAVTNPLVRDALASPTLELVPLTRLHPCQGERPPH